MVGEAAADDTAPDDDPPRLGRKCRHGLGLCGTSEGSTISSRHPEFPLHPSGAERRGEVGGPRSLREYLAARRVCLQGEWPGPPLQRPPPPSPVLSAPEGRRGNGCAGEW